MNAKVSARGRTKAGKVFKVVGVAAALLVGTSAAVGRVPWRGGRFGGGGGTLQRRPAFQWWRRTHFGGGRCRRWRPFFRGAALFRRPA